MIRAATRVRWISYARAVKANIIWGRQNNLLANTCTIGLYDWLHNTHTTNLQYIGFHLGAKISEETATAIEERITIS